MPEVQRERKYFTLRKGLNTVSNEITFPDEYTSDELNYTIESDGSRRRRRGLTEESGGSTKTVETIAAGQVNRSFKWESAGGNPAKNLLVHQIGYTLYFTDDTTTVSTTYLTDTVDLSSSVRKVASATSAATVGGEPCSFAIHRGYLIVTHKYLHPFYVSVDSSDNITSINIQLLARDFEGVDDGRAVDFHDTTAACPHQVRYNLLNRGWKDTDKDAYKTGQSKWPAKNQIPYFGYKRAAVSANQETSGGTRSFDHTKMAAELFGSSDAPQGAILLDPLDTTYGYLGGTRGTASVALSFAGGDFAGSPSSNTYLDITVASHGYSATETFSISGQAWTFNLQGSSGEDGWEEMNRNWIVESGTGNPSGIGKVTATDANTLRFYIPSITDWDSWQDTATDGQIDGNDPIGKADGTTLTVGPKACTAFAGRIWYAGIDDQQWADTIFFSQVSLTPISFGSCAQKADPTDENINQLQADDGGTIVIPNMGVVKQLRAVRNAMLVFTTKGVWEISGGRSGFTANSYSVRQITDSGCTSAMSVCQFDSATIYTGPKGVSILSPNQYTGQLEETNMAAFVLEPTWNAITAANQAKIQTAYDDAKKRLYVLYRESATLAHTYDKALVYDFKNEGWYRLGFNYGSAAGIITMVAISDADSSDSNQKMKFQAQLTTTTVDTCDMNQTAYQDFNGSESPLPYLVTGWDSSAGFQRRKQAPVIHVYNKRTGTGWTDAGGGNWTENNTGSTLMTPFWDWTEATQWNNPSSPSSQENWDASDNNYGVSGKIGKQVETYRRVRSFTPLATSNVDGYPVLATRNKVRGRGRVLSMRFDGATAKDSHLLGFTINYKITRKK